MTAAIPLKRIATVVAGQSPPSSKVSNLNDGLPFLQGNAEFGDVSPSARYSCTEAPKTAERGDVLLSVRAPVGALNIADRCYGIGRGLCAIRPRPGIERRYLWWALHASIPFLHASAAGSTYDAVTVDIVSQLLIPTPEQRKQQQIAKHLDTEITRIDALISAKRRLSDLLESRLIALANDAVRGDGGDKATGIPSLLAIPSTWRVLRNKVFAREVTRRSDDGVDEMLSVSHITGVTPRSEKTVYMFEAESTVGYKLVRPGDLVINTMWAWMGAAGVSDVHGIVSPAYGVYEFDDSIVLPKFYDILVRTPAYIAEMTRFSRGVTSSRLRLYPDEFLRLSSPVPPTKTQQAIIDRYSSHESIATQAREHIANQIQLLHERRQALIAAVVTGEMRVPRVAA
ncbi:MAG: restriction endonuclease subunit S [Acidimicrobiaceae bacterium]|nr:restriction endonuclease subunit S [Acidimicrobiaceae bacterium]MYE96877.1 restriction endonuclease subunit S [Acidimicrobiaceae bacterium]MYI53767.1 restriction endonuclease subunit S [Acidimicrobiaceae bacterium]